MNCKPTFPCQWQGNCDLITKGHIAEKSAAHECQHAISAMDGYEIKIIDGDGMVLNSCFRCEAQHDCDDSDLLSLSNPFYVECTRVDNDIPLGKVAIFVKKETTDEQ